MDENKSNEAEDKENMSLNYAVRLLNDQNSNCSQGTNKSTPNDLQISSHIKSK